MEDGSNKDKDELIEENEENLISAILLKNLSNYGYTSENLISQSELKLFLALKSPEKIFDLNLSAKLFEFLNLTESSTITISQFISGFIQFDKEIKKVKEEINEEYIKEKEIYDNMLAICEKYKNEKLNEEGFSENAKLNGEIIESNFNIDKEGIQEIIIKIIYGGQEKEIKKDIRQEQKEEEENDKIFEFKASSGEDNLEFILLTKNDSNFITEIGAKTYSLKGITTQSPFFVQIEIPNENEENNENNFAAVIKAKIALKWSDYKYYEEQKNKEEPKMQKIISDLEHAEEDIKKLEYIYSEIEEKNGKKEILKKGKKDAIAKRTFELEDAQLIVEFNNEKIYENDNKELIDDANNEKEEEEDKEEEEEKKEVKEEKEEKGELEEEKKEVEEKAEINIVNEEEQNINNNIDYNTNNVVELGIEQYNINNENEEYNNYNIDYNNNYNIDYNNNENINTEEIINNENLGQNNEEIYYKNIVNINPEQNYTSYTKALSTQSTKKVLVQENTLPLKYLPIKVNQVIVDSNVGTLPVIDGGKKVTYQDENNMEIKYGGNQYQF